MKSVYLWIFQISILQLLLGCSSMPNYPQSDHYDGTKFFNPANPVGNSFWDGAKMFLTTSFHDWPEYVENSQALDLHHTLSEDEVAVTFVNHATVLVQTQSFNFLTDPVWSERVSPVSFAGPKRHRAPGIPFEDLPKIHFIVISHNHYDHMDLETLKKLNYRFHPQFFVPLNNKKLLESCGIDTVKELDWWQSIKLEEDWKVTLTPAEHFSGRGLFDRDQTLWGSYLIQYQGHSIYFGGDTGYGSHFEKIHDRYGAPDLAFLPIGAYDPQWFMKIIHMNPVEAVQAHLDLQSKKSIGIHFGTFQLTSEKIDQPVKDLASVLNEKKIEPNQFITLSEGRTHIFKFNSATTLKCNKKENVKLASPRGVEPRLPP